MSMSTAVSTLRPTLEQLARFDRLVQYAPRFADEGRDPVAIFVEHGRDLGFNRLSRRTVIRAPHIDPFQLSPPPPDLALIRFPRYANQDRGPRLSANELDELVQMSQPPCPYPGITRRAFLRCLWTLPTISLAACTLLPVGQSPAPPPTVAARPTRSSRASEDDRRSATRRAGGTLTYAIPGEPDTLDPAESISSHSEIVGRAIYEGLVQLGPNLEPRPGLAERWAVSDDGLRHTFFLRRDVSFHDGTRFDARAAQYNLERLLGEERPRARGLVAGVMRGARAVDDYRLEVTLERPLSTALHLFGQFGVSMVSPEAHRARRGEDGKRPVGTGPFRFVERAGNEWRVERWDDGWPGKPALDGVVFRSVPDERGRLELLERDEAQLGGLVSLDQLPRLRAAEGLAADVFPTARVLGIAINTQAAPFTDRRVRQALNYAIDKDALARIVYGGHATPLGGAVAPGVAGAAPLAPYAYDPERAKKLLADAGFPGAIDVPLIGPRGRFPGDAALLGEVQKQLQAAGVKLRLELLDNVQYTTEVTKAPDETQLRLALTGWFPRAGDLRSALYPLFHSSQWMPRGENFSFFRSPAFDELLERGVQATEVDERERSFRRAQELVREEAPWIFLLSPKAVAARSEGLHEPVLLGSEVVGVSERTWLEG